MALTSSSCSDMMPKMLTHDHLEVSVPWEHHDGLRLPAHACARLRTPVPANAYANAPMRTLEVASRHDDNKMMKKHDADLDKLILKRLVIIKMIRC